MRKIVLTSCVALLLVWPALAADRQIAGDYVEARTAAVYAGACFTNSEMGLTGGEAILAWKVREGSWQGVDLSGLSVVAVLKARATLGDPVASPYPVRSILVVDDQATPAQKQALVSFARKMAGALLDDIQTVDARPIAMNESAHGSVSLRAGDEIRLQTRALEENDHPCRNADRYYEPLVALSHSMPAYTLEHKFTGNSFGETWSSPYKASAYVGTFER